ncbi:eukaryotic ribosomal protein P1 P2 family, partial [Rhizoctonia solani]
MLSTVGMDRHGHRTVGTGCRRRPLALGFPRPPDTLPPIPMSPQHQTKEVEYYRAAPTAPGMTLERVSPPRRSPSDPSAAAIAPLSISKRVKSPPSNIIVPPKPEITRPPRSPARLSANLDSTQPPNARPAPGPPPAGPLPPLPPRDDPIDPLLLRAVAAKERRRQSKNETQDIASLERSMRRLSRISLGSGPAEPTSPTDSLTVSSPSLRAEKLLRRLSRQSDGVRLPSDYGRVGISGYSVPNSAPVSPGLRGVPPPLREDSETPLALSVPMRREVPPPNNMLGLGLGLASDSFTSMSSLTSASSFSSNTISTLPSEATIKPPKEFETRTSRLGSLSSATTASTTSLITPVSPPTTNTLLTPMSPPKQLKLKGSLGLSLRIPSRSPSPSPIPDLLKDYRDSASYPLEAAYRESSIFPPSYRESGVLPLSTDLAVPTRSSSRSASPSPIQPTRQRPGARARIHSDLAPPSPRSSTEAVGSHDHGDVDVPPIRPSLESQTTPRPNIARAASPSAPTSPELNRPASPDIAYILRTTPRPTRKLSIGSVASSSTTGRRLAGPAPPSSFRRPVPSRSGSLASVPSRSSSSAGMSHGYAATASSAGFDVQGAGPEVFFGEQYDSEDSDSDLDLSTPLPHMMLRAGLLSPRSTIITEAIESAPVATVNGKLSARGEALRAKGEKVWKAEARRKVRHRDGQNLRDGVGLTTGLGWSDSEDEDAPSPLRRRLSSVLLAKTQSRPPSQLSRQSYTHMPLSRRSTYSNLESSSVSSASNPRTPAHPPMSLPPSSYSHTLPLTPSSLPGAAAVDEFGKLDFPMPPTATSWRGQPSPALRKAPSSGMLRSPSANPPSLAPSAGSASLLRSRTTSSTSSQSASQGHSPKSSVSASRVSTQSRSSVTSQRSMMPAPRFSARPQAAGIRLSAPEALRQSQSSLETTRRLSGS